jgi:Rieske Fe-S protein
MAEITRRGFICAGAAVAALAAAPAVAATGVKTVAGKTVVDLASNKALAKVGGVVELSIAKYGKVAVVRTSKSINGYSVINLSCPHAGVVVKQSSGGWLCPAPRGHGSEFALNGARKAGLAASDLRSIKFTATSKTLTIA